MAFSLQDYEILAEIGRGGYGAVFRARQKSLGREVAIKRLSPGRVQESGEILRFRREAEAMAGLSHENILMVFDHAFHGGAYYIVMEYIEGMAFDAALDSGLNPECGLYILEKTAAALTYAHAENIIHRDIKPANILLGKNGQVKLADFGLAVLSNGADRFTAAGFVIGTLGFLAPEALVSPKDVDGRVDVFSLGCIMYRVLSGALPFGGESLGDISNRILNEEPKPVTGNRFPAGLRDLTMACLVKDREKRPTMAAVHEGLREAAHDLCRGSQQELIGFVRTGSNAVPLPQEGAALAAATNGKRARSRNLLIAGLVSAAVAVLAASVVFLAGWLAKNENREGEESLPRISSGLRQSELRDEPAPSGGSLALRLDAPRPIAENSANAKAATLVVIGLNATDSLLLNSLPANGLRSADSTRVALAPGSYRLEVRSDKGLVFKKDLQLAPYQRMVVDCAPERIRHGR